MLRFLANLGLELGETSRDQLLLTAFKFAANDSHSCIA